MSAAENLSRRIDAEMGAVRQAITQFQQQHVTEFQERQQRIEQYERLLPKLADIARPRLQTLAEKLGDKVDVVPTISQLRREALFRVKSPLAQIVLRFSVSPDLDIRKVVFAYDLEVLPILMKFDKHAEIEFPLEAVDFPALESWIDDRIVHFVRTYLEMHKNPYYLKDHLVEDPVAHIKLPKYAAGATLQVQEQTYYFLSETTKAEFEQQLAKRP